MEYIKYCIPENLGYITINLAINAYIANCGHLSCNDK